jgi:tRNA(His) 5'-end guanylyltransferase
MHGKNNSQVQDMLMLEKGINWNDLQTWQKRGSCVIKLPETGEWVIDDEIPIFTQDRDYVNKYIFGDNNGV